MFFVRTVKLGTSHIFIVSDHVNDTLDWSQVRLVGTYDNELGSWTTVKNVISSDSVRYFVWLGLGDRLGKIRWKCCNCKRHMKFKTSTCLVALKCGRTKSPYWCIYMVPTWTGKKTGKPGKWEDIFQSGKS